MRVIIHAFKSLNITIDDVLQYFIWNAMPFALQTQLMAITNNNKPKIPEIEDHIFSAIERFQAIQKRKADNANFKKPVSLSNYAANVNIKSSPGKNRACILCSNDEFEADHSINRCGKYSNAKAKIAELKKLGACTKCGNKTHKPDSCAFKFYKKCFFCTGLHFSYLCPNNTNTVCPDKKVVDNKVSTNIISIDAATLNFVSDFPTLLPTFHVEMGNYMLHGIKDSGAQCALILSCVAEKENLKVLKETNIQINGFNASKPYATKIVQVPLTIAGKLWLIEAVCVPEINIYLELSGINKVVSKFVKNKINLADKSLLDCNESEKISNLEFVLGANYGHLLSETHSVFSTNNCNCYYTPLGVILMGDLGNIDGCISNFSREQDFIDKEKSSAYNKLNSIPALQIQPEVKVPKLAEKNCSSTSVNPFTTELGSLDMDKLEEVLAEQIRASDPENLDAKCCKILGSENLKEDLEAPRESIEQILTKVSRDENGRLILPILWNTKNAHMLGKNFELARQVLFSISKKYQNYPDKLKMIDDVFKEQEKLNIIEEVPDLQKLSNDPNSSFLAHMPVFRLDNESTKCRNVFLSNLSGKNADGRNMSHNQTIDTGPNLNKKLSVSLTNLRFDKYLITFDLFKAFLNLGLSEDDQIKLNFLLFNNLEEKKFVRIK